MNSKGFCPVTPPEIDLTINTDLVRGILTRFIKTEITRIGLNCAVIGLSGGIDSSAIVAFMADVLLAAMAAVVVLFNRLVWRRLPWDLAQAHR